MPQMRVQLTFSQPIDYEGLNQKDKDRITKVGFGKWFDEACRAQEKRLSGQRMRA